LRDALVAAGFATIALRATLDIVRRLSTRPAQDLTSPDVLNRHPFVTVLSLLMMTAAIAGIVEEAAFRGYMQKPIEERHGATVAILLVSVLFCAAHYRFEAADPWPWLIFTPAYFVTAATLGTLAYLTNSIVIGVFVHSMIDAVALLRYWWTGIPKSVWEVGFDSLFWTECTILFVFGGATVWALRRLAAAKQQA
jgi:membrane protease YdiL (CAAX protease family)